MAWDDWSTAAVTSSSQYFYPAWETSVSWPTADSSAGGLSIPNFAPTSITFSQNNFEFCNDNQINYESNERTEEEQKEREQAEKVAEELLLLHIGEEQFKRYKESGGVVISSLKSLNRTYRVDARNRIEVYEDGKLIEQLCVNLINEVNHRDSYWLPDADVVLGKIFLLENDEERLLRVANHEEVLSGRR